MSFTFVQSRSGGAGAEPESLAYTSNVGAGHLLVGAVYWNSSSLTCSVSDNVNGAWTAVGSAQVGVTSLSAWSMQMFYFLSSGSGATTVTADISGAVLSIGIAIHEYSFTGGSVSVDGTPVYNNHASATPTTNAVVTTVAADLLFAACVTGTGVGSAGTGYVQRENANFGGNSTEDDTDGGAAGSVTASFNVSGTPDNIVGLIAFADAVATAAPTPLKPFDPVPFMSNQRI